MRFFLFVFLLVLATPFWILGSLLFVGQAIFLSKRTGVSVTALIPLLTRWSLHKLRKRNDPVGAYFLEHFTGVSSVGLWLVMWPLFQAMRLSGYEPNLFKYPVSGTPTLTTMLPARTAWFDEVVNSYHDECSQLVILGAGFDSRSQTHADRLKVFEVDAPATHTLKQQLLNDSPADFSHVTLVAVDFEKTDWLVALKSQGFDPSLPTIVIWEGVIYYLSEADILRVLSSVSTLAPGSVLAFDYFTASFVRPNRALLRLFHVFLDIVGEPMRFCVSTAASTSRGVKWLLEKCGLRLSKHATFVGDRDETLQFGGLVMAEVPKCTPSKTPIQLEFLNIAQ